MRPRLGWSDVATAGRVGVWGVGVEGAANLRRLEVLGVTPVVVDDAPRDDLAVATDHGGLELLAGCDVVVKTPGISRYRDDLIGLARSGVAVVGGLGLWLADAPLERVICVTGTKGKSTTVSIAGHLASELGLRCFVGGNLGTPPQDPEAPEDADLWVIEVSSYQATDVPVSPPVVGVTSLHEDHLDWHRTVENYYEDKLSLAAQPGADVTVAPRDDERVRERRGLLGPRVEWVDADAGSSLADALGLVGRHNAINAAVARGVLVAAGVDGAADDQRLEQAARGFGRLAHRLEHVHQVGRVEFVDDGLATNVLPTLAALDTFSGRTLVLLVGGQDRGIDYRPLADGIRARRAPTLVVTMDDAGDRIATELDSVVRPANVELRRATSIDRAVEDGFAWVQPEGVVLLSPAAPSFGRYRSYRERSEAFLQASRRCSPGGAT